MESTGDKRGAARTRQEPATPPAEAPAARETAPKRPTESPSLRKKPSGSAPASGSALFDSGGGLGKRRKIEHIWGKRVGPTWHEGGGRKDPRVAAKPTGKSGGHSVADTTLDFLWECVEYNDGHLRPR